MLITIKHDHRSFSSISSKPKLLFVCEAQGEINAIPRAMHSHSDRLEIMFIYKGCGNYIIDGEFYSVKEGDLLIFNAGSIHDEQPIPSKNLMIYSCGVTDLKLNDLPMNHIISKKQIPMINVSHYSEKFKQFFESIIYHSTYNNSVHNEIIDYTNLSFLLFIHSVFTEREQYLTSKKVTLGQRIKEYLDKNYLDGIDINSISETLNVNRYYLSHVFKDFSGYPPKQYIIRRRIGESQSLLLNTDYSIAKIASKVGYSNVNNFHRIFEQIVGMSPGKYKKLWLNKS